MTQTSFAQCQIPFNIKKFVLFRTNSRSNEILVAMNQTFWPKMTYSPFSNELFLCIGIPRCFGKLQSHGVRGHGEMRGRVSTKWSRISMSIPLPGLINRASWSIRHVDLNTSDIMKLKTAEFPGLAWPECPLYVTIKRVDTPNHGVVPLWIATLWLINWCVLCLQWTVASSSYI